MNWNWKRFFIIIPIVYIVVWALWALLNLGGSGIVVDGGPR